MLADESDQQVFDKNKNALRDMSRALQAVTDYADDVVPEKVGEKDLVNLMARIQKVSGDGYVGMVSDKMNHLAIFKEEVIDLLGMLINKDDTEKIGRTIRSYTKLFKGTSGTGMNYFMGYKKPQKKRS